MRCRHSSPFIHSLISVGRAIREMTLPRMLTARGFAKSLQTVTNTPVSTNRNSCTSFALHLGYIFMVCCCVFCLQVVARPITGHILTPPPTWHTSQYINHTTPTMISVRSMSRVRLAVTNVPVLCHRIIFFRLIFHHQFLFACVSARCNNGAN